VIPSHHLSTDRAASGATIEGRGISRPPSAARGRALHLLDQLFRIASPLRGHGSASARNLRRRPSSAASNQLAYSLATLTSRSAPAAAHLRLDEAEPSSLG